MIEKIIRKLHESLSHKLIISSEMLYLSFHSLFTFCTILLKKNTFRLLEYSETCGNQTFLGQILCSE